LIGGAPLPPFSVFIRLSCGKFAKYSIQRSYRQNIPKTEVRPEF
jgi:hypothetical protein